jgi:hypothetical protein
MKILSILLVLLLGQPSLAWAIQTHGYAGLYIHQGAHILFLAAMVSFALRLWTSGLIAQPAWRLMAWGAWLFGAWNIWAFIGHFITLTIPDRNVLVFEGELVASLHMESWQEVAYYILQMDHLVCLPAIILFYLGIRTMLKTFPQPKPARERHRQEPQGELVLNRPIP